MDQTNLLALADFNLVATHGGFGKANRATGRPKATLSRHVAQLEESLGVRLLERVGHAIRLTEEGKALRLRTEGLLGEVAEIARELATGRANPRGRLRVSAPMAFAFAAMGRLAAEFLRLYPEVQLEIVAEDREVDLIEDGYDIAIRVNPRHGVDLVGRCFYRDEFVVVAPPTWRRPDAEAGERAPEPVAAVVGKDAPDLDDWTLRDGDATLTMRRKAVLRLSSPPMIRDAVLAGAGAAVLARNFVEADIAAGRLLCWGRTPDRAVEAWVLHTSRRLISSRVSAFVQFLCDAYADASVGLGGRTPSEARARPEFRPARSTAHPESSRHTGGRRGSAN